jgi:nucleoside recognition membrane protein YjiH
MQEIFFLARHTPFWSVPLIVIGAEFAYLFWLRKKKATVLVCLIFTLIGLVCTGFYVWAGGPEKSVKIVKKIYIEHFLNQPSL